MSSQDLYQLANTRQLEEIRNWQDLNGAFHKHPSAEAQKLLEEVIELCVASGMYEDAIKETVLAELFKAKGKGELNQPPNNRAITEEYGDVLTCVIAYRNKLAIRSVDSLSATLEKIRGRTWKADKNGILRRPR